MLDISENKPYGTITHNALRGMSIIIFLKNQATYMHTVHVCNSKLEFQLSKYVDYTSSI